jgi:predicted nucleotidyltransferase
MFAQSGDLYCKLIRSYDFIVPMATLQDLFPKARGEIFRLLFADPERALHLRELARASHLSVGSLQSEVAHLASAGLLLSRRDGNRLYFRANREHPLFPELRGIALKTSGLRDQLANALEGLEGIDFAFVFGSFASGASQPASDIDLLVVGSVGLRQLSPRLRPAADALNREINPYTTSRKALAEKARKGDAFITSVLSAPKIWIQGSPHELEGLAG